MMDKKLRLDYILAHLTENESATRHVLAEICECSERTIQRCIDDLRNDRWPIEASNDGYYLRKPSRAERAPSKHKQLAVFTLLGCSIDKNLEAFSPKLSHELRSFLLKVDDLPASAAIDMRATDVSSISLSDEDLDHFGKLARFILNRLAVRLYYTPLGRSEGMLREVFPIQLKEREGTWYLVAYDYDRQADRVFALKRLNQVELSRKNLTPPSDEIIERNIASGQFSIWDSSQANVQLVKIKLSDYAAWFIQENTIHPSQTLKIISKDEVILSLETSDFTGLLLWLRRFLTYVEIISPQDLKDQFIRDLEHGLSRNAATDH